MFLRSLSWQSLRSLDTVRLVGLISFFGQLYFFVPFMTPYLLQRNLTIAEIAGLQTMLMVATLVMEIPTGIIADRLGHVWSYRIALVVLACGEGLFLLARDYPTFLLIQFITGTGFAFASGSVDAILYDSLPEGDRVSGMQRAKGFLGAATQMGSVVAYSIGGVIAADLTLSRMTVTIVMGTLAVTTAAALSFRLREAPHIVERTRPDSRKLLGTAWRAIRSNRDLVRIIALSLVTCSFGAHMLVFYQQYFLETGVAGVWFGLGLSLASMVVVLGQLHAWRLPRAIGTRRALVLATGVPGLLYLAMAWNGTAWLAVALFIVQWGAMHLSVPLFSGLFNAHLPDEARATSLSLISAIVTVYIGVGGVFLGWLAERSLPMTFALMGVVILAGAALIRVDDRHASGVIPDVPAP
ncbi:MAG: MFS transporter [Chloroflexia bacterium]|nr:MFS transporter [Chloroflexia bacterium]